MMNIHRFIALLTLFLLSGCLQPPVEVRDDDMAARTLENKQVTNPSELLPVAPVIPSHGMWTGNQQLGSESEFAPDSNNRQTILKLDEWGPPEVWTISLYLANNLESYNGFSVTAEIDFGVGGSTQRVKIDWANGAQISLPMNAVNVVASFENVDVLTEGRGLRLGVQLARGNRSGQHSPVRTIAEGIFVDPLGQSPVFKIPAFAKSVYAISTGGTANDLDDPLIKLITLSGNFSPIVTGTIDGTACSAGVGLPVVGQARFVRLANGTAGVIGATLYADISG